MSGRLTLGIARTTLPSVCFAPGVAASAALAAAPINTLTQWLFSAGKWKGTTQKVAFSVFDNTYITTPRNVLTILGAAIRGTGDRSTQSMRYDVRNEWYEFLPGGTGLDRDKPYDVTGFNSQGDGFVIFRDLPSAGKIKIYSTATESAGSFHVRGYSGGQKAFTGGGSTIGNSSYMAITGSLTPAVTGHYAPLGVTAGTDNLDVYFSASTGYFIGQLQTGEMLIGNNFPLADSTIFWSKIASGLVGTYSAGTGATGTATVAAGATIEGENIAMPTVSGNATLSATTFDAGNSLYSIVKPATNGVLLMYHVASGGTETLLGRYEPGELLPTYRRYSVPYRGDSTDQVAAYCKLRQVDVLVDNDEIIPGNLNAIETGLQALNYRRKDDMPKANEYISMAVAELNSELDAFNAEQSYGSVQFDQLTSAGAIANIL